MFKTFTLTFLCIDAKPLQEREEQLKRIGARKGRKGGKNGNGLWGYKK